MTIRKSNFFSIKSAFFCLVESDELATAGTMSRTFSLMLHEVSTSKVEGFVSKVLVLYHAVRNAQLALRRCHTASRVGAFPSKRQRSSPWEKAAHNRNVREKGSDGAGLFWLGLPPRAGSADGDPWGVWPSNRHSYLVPLNGLWTALCGWTVNGMESVRIE